MNSKTNVFFFIFNVYLFHADMHAISSFATMNLKFINDQTTRTWNPSMVKQPEAAIYQGSKQQQKYNITLTAMIKQMLFVIHKWSNNQNL